MRTAGRVTMKFYPGGVMANDAQVLRKVRVGQLQGGPFSSGGLVEPLPRYEPLRHPLLFRSQEEVDAVRAKIDPLMAVGLDTRVRDLWLHGRQDSRIRLSNEPIIASTRCGARKVWVPEGDQISFLGMETMGCHPLPCR